MEDRDRLGLNVVVAGGAALAGVALGGGPGVSSVAAMVPVLVQELTAHRTENVTTVTEHACQLRGFGGEELRAWVQRSDRHAAYLQEALEAAWATLDGHRLRTLGYVLADGIADDARLDVDQLVIRALRELEAGHLAVLVKVADWGKLGVTDDDLRHRLSRLADGLPALIARLESVGCVLRTTRVHEHGRELVDGKLVKKKETLPIIQRRSASGCSVRASWARRAPREPMRSGAPGGYDPRDDRPVHRLSGAVR